MLGVVGEAACRCLATVWLLPVDPLHLASLLFATYLSSVCSAGTAVRLQPVVDVPLAVTVWVSPSQKFPLHLLQRTVLERGDRTPEGCAGGCGAPELNPMGCCTGETVLA